MDFADKIKFLADRAEKIKSGLNTEEATKTALVLPFIQTLGYDIFDPHEVVPEYTADVAGRKGEKIDYAILQDGKPIMIFECKSYGANLSEIHHEQLHRYFLTLESSIGVLTNGLRYQFFSNTEDGKNMDATPFMEFRLDKIDPTLLPELRKLRKGSFDIKNTLDTVNELKFNRQVKLALAANLEAPDVDFLDYLLLKAGIRGMRQKAKEERYLPYTKRAFNEFITEQVDSRLKTALAATSKKEEEPPPPPPPPAEEVDIITDNEWQAYYLVKSLLMGIVDSERVVQRDLKGTGRSAVDIDSLYKPLVFMNFLDPDKLTVEIVTDAATKQRQTYTINKVEDLLQYADTIKGVARGYIAGIGKKSDDKPE